MDSMTELSPLDLALENDALWLEDVRSGRFSRYAIPNPSGYDQSVWFCNECGAEIFDTDEGCEECGNGQPEIEDEEE